MTRIVCITTLILVAALSSPADTIEYPVLAESAIFSQSSVSLHWKAQVAGDVVAWDRIDLASQARVRGDLYAGAGISQGWKASAGTAYDSLGYDAFDPYILPTFSDGPGGADVRVGDRGSLTLAPGEYGSLRVDWKGELTLSAGTYHFDSVLFGDQSRVRLDTTGGDVLIYSDGATALHWKADVQRTGDGGAMLASAGAMTLASESSLDASVFGRQGVTLDWKAEVVGQVHAYGDVTLYDQSYVHGRNLTTVPAPASLSLFVIGAAGLLRRRRPRP